MAGPTLCPALAGFPGPTLCPALAGFPGPTLCPALAGFPGPTLCPCLGAGCVEGAGFCVACLGPAPAGPVEAPATSPRLEPATPPVTVTARGPAPNARGPPILASTAGEEWGALDASAPDASAAATSGVPVTASPGFRCPCDERSVEGAAAAEAGAGESNVTGPPGRGAGARAERGDAPRPSMTVRPTSSGTRSRLAAATAARRRFAGGRRGEHQLPDSANLSFRSKKVDSLPVNCCTCSLRSRAPTLCSQQSGKSQTWVFWHRRDPSRT